ncbi:ankyrin repeat domain-containing protein [Deinococcus hopiensis]|uniref:FOG: Ankyrin repeat n=1 Tax=Deinococcus hopiensis KR-140 TaxID=695939 RepID=A0A1W1UT62_9DEIO|nr:ankyrin repeat domain-containing protein [Deinococcus hopiensis]SMB84338.1 FOG: Ankyrin repeat [Deinococcus hopiensis KR-140]
MPRDIAQRWNDLRLECSAGPVPLSKLTEALRLAAWHGHLEMTADLLTLGADPNAPAEDGRLSALSSAVEQGWLPGIELILQRGGDVHRCNRAGQTLLMEAIEAQIELEAQDGRPRDLQMLHLLLRYGADPTVTIGAGLTAEAVARRHGWTEAAELLVL